MKNATVPAEIRNMSLKEKLAEATRLSSLLGYDDGEPRDLPISDDDYDFLWGYVDGHPQEWCMTHIECQCSLAAMADWDVEKAEAQLEQDILRLRKLAADHGINDPGRFASLDINAVCEQAANMARYIQSDPFIGDQFHDAVMLYAESGDANELCFGNFDIQPKEGVDRDTWDQHMANVGQDNDGPRHRNSFVWLCLNSCGHPYCDATQFLIETGAIKESDI